MDTSPGNTARSKRSVKRKRIDDYDLDDSDIEDFLRHGDEYDDVQLNFNSRDDFFNVDLLFDNDSHADPDYVPSINSGDDSEPEPIPSTSTDTQKAKKKKATVSLPKKRKPKKRKVVELGLPWTAQDFSQKPTALLQPAYVVVDSSDWDEDKYVQQYFDDEILKTIVDKTNQYYLFKTGKIKLQLAELKVWLGINFVMSALQLPKIRKYWEKRWRVSLVANAMRRERFFFDSVFNKSSF